MFLRIVRVRSTEQSGIKGVKILFDPNIIDMQYNKKPGWFFKRTARFFVCFLFVKVCFENTFRCLHRQDSQIKVIIGNSDMIFKYHIFLEFGKYQVRSVLFSLNLITDIIVYTLPGNFSWISGSFDLFFNCLL